MAREQWYNRNPARLRKEKQVMTDRFPDAQLKSLSDDSYGWVYSFTSEKWNRYKILVKYPANYPAVAPEGYIREPVIKPRETKHMFSNESLCLFDTREGRSWERKSTAATAMAWVVCWCNAYENWLETGEWPGDEH